MARWGWVGIGLAMAACTSVKMVQRDGCWMKQTSSTLGGSREELGFCTKPPPTWAEDRLARLVQECIAQSDYRWENRALAAWSRNEPIPPQETGEQMAKVCINEASAALGIEAENAALKSRLAEVSRDRDALRSTAETDRAFLEQNSEKMVSALGEAAKKPAPSATATATSTGTATTESDLRSTQKPAEAAPVTVVGLAMPAAAPPAAVSGAPSREFSRASPCPGAGKASVRKAGDKAGGETLCEKGKADAPIPLSLGSGTK